MAKILMTPGFVALALGATIACSDDVDPDDGAGAAGAAGATGGQRMKPDGAADAAAVAFRIFVRNTASAGGFTTSTGAPLDVVYSPGVYWVHAEGSALFDIGAPASAGLERLAEDGAFDPLLREAESQQTGTAGFFGADDLGVSYDEAPLMPGQSADFVIQAKPGERLELAMMWAQSNDTFVATLPGGFPLFDGGAPRLGPVTDHLALFDAGTEENQEPGVGDTQAPRQTEPDQGSPEGGTIEVLTNDTDLAGFAYPQLAETLVVDVQLDSP